MIIKDQRKFYKSTIISNRKELYGSYCIFIFWILYLQYANNEARTFSAPAIKAVLIMKSTFTVTAKVSQAIAYMEMTRILHAIQVNTLMLGMIAYWTREKRVIALMVGMIPYFSAFKYWTSEKRVITLMVRMVPYFSALKYWAKEKRVIAFQDPGVTCNARIQLEFCAVEFTEEWNAKEQAMINTCNKKAIWKPRKILTIQQKMFKCWTS